MPSGPLSCVTCHLGSKLKSRPDNTCAAHHGPRPQRVILVTPRPANTSPLSHPVPPTCRSHRHHLLPPPTMSLSLLPSPIPHQHTAATTHRHLPCTINISHALPLATALTFLRRRLLSPTTSSPPTPLPCPPGCSHLTHTPTHKQPHSHISSTPLHIPTNPLPPSPLGSNNTSLPLTPCSHRHVVVVTSCFPTNISYHKHSLRIVILGLC